MMLAEVTFGDVMSILFWSVVTIALGMLAYVGVMRLKSWLAAPDNSAPIGFTLSDLRQLHKSGQMSDEEFEKAKALMLASLKKQDEDKKQKPTGGFPIDPKL